MEQYEQHEATIHPRLTFAAALAKLQSDGYVRMEGHTATNADQLRELYEVIFPAKDGGTFSQPADFEKALAAAKKAEAAAMAGKSDADKRNDELAKENEALKQQLAAAKKSA